MRARVRCPRLTTLARAQRQEPVWQASRDWLASFQRQPRSAPTPALDPSELAVWMQQTRTGLPQWPPACASEAVHPVLRGGQPTILFLAPSKNKKNKERHPKCGNKSRMDRREVIVTVCLLQLVLAAADTTRSVTVPSVTEVCGDPRIAHSHVAVSTDAPSGCRPGPRSWGVTFC